MSRFNLIDNYLLFLLSVIPLSILIGPSISLVNIFLIIFCFIFYYKKIFFFSLFKNKAIIGLITIYLYLLLNSLISIDYSIGFLRNFCFFRFILLFIVINYLFSSNQNTNLIYKIWLSILSVVVLDSFLEFFTGGNILGYTDSSGKRIVSFFKDEPIVAGYLNGFIFIVFGYLFSNFDKKKIDKKFFTYFIVILFFLCILITGERSNTLKFLFGTLIFVSLNHFIRVKLLFFVSVILLLLLSYFSSDRLQLRYGGQLINLVNNQEKREVFFEKNLYVKLYRSGFEVFKKYPVYGVGNKNYRLEVCGDGLNKKYVCNTHPHQIYLEFLSEHGLLGSLSLLSIIFFLIFRNFKIMIRSKNMIQIGAFCFLLTSFLPILPSGSFFTDFNATLFWLNFSIFYASNLETNIFKNGGLAQ